MIFPVTKISLLLFCWRCEICWSRLSNLISSKRSWLLYSLSQINLSVIAPNQNSGGCMTSPASLGKIFISFYISYFIIFRPGNWFVSAAMFYGILDKLVNFFLFAKFVFKYRTSFFRVKVLWTLFHVILFSCKDSHLLHIACFVLSFSIEIASSFATNRFSKKTFSSSVKGF